MNDIENSQLCATAEQAIRHGTGRLANVPGLIKKIIRNECWKSRRLVSGEICEMRSLAELITTPLIRGWGEDPKKIEALLKDDAEALAMFHKALHPHGGDHKSEETIKVDNVNLDQAPKGNSRSYTCARLQREYPDLFEQVCAGELTANAAAIKAGFRKVKSPDEKAVDAFRKAENRLVVLTAVLDALAPHERAWLKEVLTQAGP